MINQTHVMMDLETLGTRAGCAILSVGLVSFTMEGYVGPGWGANISRESCVSAGLHVAPETEAWWEKQSSEARAALSLDQQDLAAVAREAHRLFRSSGATCIWSNGAGFDVPIWEEACRLLGERVPWKFYDVRDTRTIWDLAGVRNRDLPFIGTAHCALDDAKHQARLVQLAAGRLLGVHEKKTSEAVPE